jgi:hypothetical protein
LGCAVVFKPKSFSIFKTNENKAILSGTWDKPTSLWRVPLQREMGHETDSIPPPTPKAGMYVEANAVSIQDNATYVRYVHACLGYTTFLEAVTAESFTTI